MPVSNHFLGDLDASDGVLFRRWQPFSIGVCLCLDGIPHNFATIHHVEEVLARLLETHWLDDFHLRLVKSSNKISNVAPIVIVGTKVAQCISGAWKRLPETALKGSSKS